MTLSIEDASAALAHPLVLRGAWLRVNGWYEAGNLAPQPELSIWRLHPEAQLRRLAADLASDAWHPEPWPQVPHPKRGARLRHYVVPSVRDQVAFMAHVVLLGPLIDLSVPQFAFGNRWYRPIMWDRTRTPSHWVHLPYPLLESRTYLPYARSHGLYRRVAEWTVACMTGARTSGEDFGGTVPRAADYERDALPAWTRDEWWSGLVGEDGQAWWATLDVELAYPSVRFKHLAASLENMLASSDTSTRMDGGRSASGYLVGYPAAIAASLDDSAIVEYLADRLLRGLSQVRVDARAVPVDSWRPVHAKPTLPPEKEIGLPTGLAVSGLLLNVALHPMDRVVMAHLESQDAGRRSAFVRFADDMTVLSRSDAGLLETIDAVRRGLAGDTQAPTDDPAAASNLHLNLAKVGPKPWREVITVYLEDQGWTKCPECGQLLPAEHRRPGLPLAEWWAIARESGGRTLREDVARSTVGPADLGPFVTSLVARLSDIGSDRLQERFGAEARKRLAELHALARFDIDDLQVRSDTRRVFAANRLVRAWLPRDSSEASKALNDIRNSIGHVLGRTPWRFVLWRAAIRAAARRPPEGDLDSGDQEAAVWLRSLLSHVAHWESAQPPTNSWLRIWPEEGEATTSHHSRDPTWARLYLSYHRTAFWHALAAVQRELWVHHDRYGGESGGHGPSPRLWTLRAVPDGDQDRVARFLGSIDQWTSILYPDALPDLATWSWELDQLVEAVLASSQRLPLAEAWRRAARPDVLAVPRALPTLERMPRTAGLLERFGRLADPADRAKPLGLRALAHVLLGGNDHRVGSLLFPPGQAERIGNARRHPARALSVGAALGCADYLSPDLVSALTWGPEQTAASLAEDPFALAEYGLARRVLLGQVDDGND